MLLLLRPRPTRCRMRVDGRRRRRRSSRARRSTSCPGAITKRAGEAHVASKRRAEVDEVELRMLGSFEFEDHDSGAARAGTVGAFDAVGMLGNLWRRMQVR